jgi:hypothetical protein
MAGDEQFYAAAERRIEYITVGAGIAGAAAVALLVNMRGGWGVACGTALSWINFRWMKQGVGTLAKLGMAQEGKEKPRVPRSVYFKFLGRYALLLGAAYVILFRFHAPAWSVVAGLFAVVAGVVIELVLQILGIVQGKQAGSPNEDT